MIKYNNGRYTSALFKEPEYFIYLHQTIFVDKAYLKKQKHLLHFSISRQAKRKNGCKKSALNTFLTVL